MIVLFFDRRHFDRRHFDLCCQNCRHFDRRHFDRRHFDRIPPVDLLFEARRRGDESE